jgi:hypothetical protein
VPSNLTLNKKACTYNVILRRSRNHFCRGEATSIIYTKCVSVTLIIQHAKRKRRVILSLVASPTLQRFFTLSQKEHNCHKKNIENKMCVFICSTLFFQTSLILIRIRLYIIIKVYSYSCKVLVIRVIFF